MRQCHTIQSLIASFLLALSLLGALPKSYFHDVVANHTDAVSCPHTDCVHSEGFHCGFADQVVTAPFEPAGPAIMPARLAFSRPETSSFVSVALSTNAASADGRGPPHLL